MGSRMSNRDSFLSKRYYDKKKYPYGFSRSGDFTKQEADILETKGSYFKALEEGVVTDLSEEDIRIIKVFRGELEAQNLEERTWLKYSSSNKRKQIWLMEREKNSRTLEVDEEEFEFDPTLEEDFDE